MNMLRPTETTRWPIQLMISLGLLTLMALMVRSSPQHLVFDETFHLPMAFRLAAGESFHDLLTQPTWSSVALLFGAPRIISNLQGLCGHEKAAEAAAEQENLISTIDEIA
jgi:hypothetical protein